MSAYLSLYLTVYTVKEGDTYESIVKNVMGKRGKESEIIELLEYNGLDITQKLYKGQKLKIPPKLR